MKNDAVIQWQSLNWRRTAILDEAVIYDSRRVVRFNFPILARSGLVCADHRTRLPCAVVLVRSCHFCDNDRSEVGSLQPSVERWRNMTNDECKIDWERVCLTSPVGPYAEPVAGLAPLILRVDLEAKVELRRSHLSSYCVVRWPNDAEDGTVTYAVIAEFKGVYARPEAQLTKFETWPTSVNLPKFDGRVVYDEWTWTPEFFDTVGSLQRRLVGRSLDLLNNSMNPGWAALRELVLCEVVPFATKYPRREYVQLLLTSLNGLVRFWARVLRLKWYLGHEQCSAMLDPNNVEYPRYHPISLDQVEAAVQDFGSPT